MDATFIVILIIVVVVGGGLAYGLYRLALGHQRKKTEAAREAFATLSRFDPTLVHGFGRDAVAYDEGRNQLAWMRKGEEPRLVPESAVGSWFLGMIVSGSTTEDADGNQEYRETRSRYLRLFGPDGAQTHNVGFVRRADCDAWEEPMTRLFGPDRRIDDLDSHDE